MCRLGGVLWAGCVRGGFVHTLIHSHRKSKNVGAGLLANAVCQSTSLFNDTPHSRASPLPH
ncbi:hypothetical protein EAH78_11680 [Pseudomonas arsenicoxydans]|uniref:Uncharacterized protein n=1 Tax=Pseudomonas arsenicoxydans TaxID=702115 RepID=A0A502HUJ4_9PSED|nr:hypothetical protein EAH78_11680 [Pseudomonas arsenicoxydans]